MTVEIINPVCFPGWDGLISEIEGCSVFHSAAWAKVLQQSYRYYPRYFTWMENGRAKGVIPMVEIKSPLTGCRGVSLAFSDYCEPLGDDPQIFDKLFARIVEYARESGWKSIEMRGGQRFLSGAPPSASYLGHSLLLSEDENSQLSLLRNSTKRNIRKAVDAGVRTNIYHSLQSVKEFYDLHCLTRKRHGTPPQPFSFFRNIHECLIEKNRGSVILASHENKIIAAAVYLHFGDAAIYKFGASDERYQQFRANNLVMWDAIRHYAGKGCRTFCFGRTDSDNDGLRQFKCGWGVTESTIAYHTYDVVKGRYVGSVSDGRDRYGWLFRSMPLPMLKAAGQLLYRHVG